MHAMCISLCAYIHVHRTLHVVHECVTDQVVVCLSPESSYQEGAEVDGGQLTQRVASYHNIILHLRTHVYIHTYVRTYVHMHEVKTWPLATSSQDMAIRTSIKSGHCH